MLSNRIVTNIEEDDTVVLYPTFGYLARQGRAWRIPITGSVYTLGDACRRKRRWLKLLQQWNGFHPNDEQRELFEQRVSAFVAATERGKRLAVRVGGEIFPIRRKTRRNGLLSGSLILPVEAVERAERWGEWLALDVVRPAGDDAGYRGLVRLLEPTGLSVISDIDDTVKVTQVTCRRTLLENTFLKEFEAVAGMSELYRSWAASGAALHYVSSSPWQLYAPLVQMFERAQMPLGTFHLRSYRLHEHILRRLWMLKKRAKASVLKAVVRAFPRRRFVLVGDSTERDPEIYGSLARRYGGQIQAVYIRQVAPRPMTPGRCAKAFRGLDADRWRVFFDPQELPRELTAAE